MRRRRLELLRRISTVEQYSWARDRPSRYNGKAAHAITVQMSTSTPEDVKNVLLTPPKVLSFVEANYVLPSPQTCDFIRRGFNDHYQIAAGDERYIFRVYLNGKYYIESPEAFQFELDLLTYLHEQELPVAYPISRKDGESLGWTETEFGKRATALFSYAAGEERNEQLPTPGQCAEIGKTMAAFHLAANSFRSEHQRYHLDLKYLVEEPLRLIAQQGDEEAQARLASLQPVDELVATVKALNVDGDEYGIIHGDLQGGNMHFQGDEVTFFDFDHCAYGWRAYDLTMPLFLPEAQKTAFLQGYESLRPLTESERDSLPTFMKLRKLWDMGDHLATAALRKRPGT